MFKHKKRQGFQNNFLVQYPIIYNHGAGLSGSVIAEQASSRSGLKSLIIDKRNHIGGNCYDYIDEHGIRVSKYGAHIFHTKHQRVWDYIQQFSDWIPYEHKVKGMIHTNGTYHVVPVPPNQVRHSVVKRFFRVKNG